MVVLCIALLVGCQYTKGLIADVGTSTSAAAEATLASPETSAAIDALATSDDLSEDAAEVGSGIVIGFLMRFLPQLLAARALRRKEATGPIVEA